MGSRGAFISVNEGNFKFVEGGQTYHKIGEIDNVHVLMRQGNLSVKAPEYSHTESRTYAIIQDGKLKHIAYYDENHKQVRCVDFGHAHSGIIPHVHENIDHKNAYEINLKDIEIAKKVARRFKVKWK